MRSTYETIKSLSENAAGIARDISYAVEQVKYDKEREQPQETKYLAINTSGYTNNFSEEEYKEVKGNDYYLDIFKVDDKFAEQFKTQAHACKYVMKIIEGMKKAAKDEIDSL